MYAYICACICTYMLSCDIQVTVRIRRALKMGQQEKLSIKKPTLKEYKAQAAAGTNIDVV